MEGEKFTPEDATKFKAMGEKQIVTDDLENFGRASDTIAVQEVAEQENARFDALEKAKVGGSESAKDAAAMYQQNIKSGPLDTRAIAHEAVAQELGTDAENTPRFHDAEHTASGAMDERLEQKRAIDGNS
jgi:hypothetical protein